MRHRPVEVEVFVLGRDFRGVHHGNVGVYTHKGGSTYAGAHEGGKAHGYGVIKSCYGYTSSGQLANGGWHGHSELHCANGDVVYALCEHGNPVHRARVFANGACVYGNQPCGADHAGIVALKAAAQQAGVRNASSRIPHPRPQRPRHGRNRNVCWFCMC